MIFFVLLMLAALSAAALPAQQPSPQPNLTASRAAYDHTQHAPRAVASRTNSVIRIDGSLDEPAWNTARSITEFTQLDPTEGQPATERTDVRILYDDVALYIGARTYDRHAVRSRVGRRDMSMSASDWLTVILDTRHDHRTATGFEINPAGVRRDQTRATGAGEDDSWEPVWEARTSVGDSGWVAELRIPFSQLRFTGAPVHTWGLQVERSIARNQEFSVWAFTPRDEPGGIPRFGHLTGISEIATGKRLELMPYVVSRAEYIDRRGNPFRENREYTGDAGLDLKYRVTSSLTLDGTINPDFGQIEVDPAVINLTAFETFFPEKRPFFIEGSEMFRFGEDGSNSVFYSRRIGRQPSLTPPFAARDVPDASQILGAAKLTGRTAGGWTMGVLDAVTRREIARFRTPDGEAGESVAEPFTNYFVGRVRRESRAGQTAIGGLLGAVNRELDTDALSSALRSAAYSGGADLYHQWAQRTFTLRGFLVGSHIRGDRAVISAAQRLPYHYFQRPDADHLEYDTTRTSLTGFAGAIQLQKRTGRLWSNSIRLNTVSPDYEVSDLGFQRRGDRIDLEIVNEYQDTRRRGNIRNRFAYLNWLYEHNYAWENISHRIFSGAYAQFLNYWSVNTNLQYSVPHTVDDRLTRGGPAARRPGFVSGSLNLSSDPRKRVVGSAGASARTGGNGNAFEVFPSLTIRPKPHWDVRLAPVFARSHDVAQYLQRVADPSATQTYGNRYVFASIDQKIFSLQTRVNYTFTPGLSLQVYAQPFIATGEYGPAKEFAQPRTYEFREYGTEVGEIFENRIYPSGRGQNAVSFAVPQPDFNIRSLRGNAVVRWEWRPGSTLYFAWQQTRNGFRPIGDFDFGRDFDAIFAESPDNVFLVKVSYWINP